MLLGKIEENKSVFDAKFIYLNISNFFVQNLFLYSIKTHDESESVLYTKIQQYYIVFLQVLF
jgi:hypothetical protein